jgi:putative thioredoxin
MASSHVLDVTSANFQQEVVEFSRKHPVLIDFWAEWCGPCKTLGPTLEKLAGEYRGAFRLAKVNTDVERELAGAFRIQSLPTVVIFYQGQVLDQLVGALPEADLRHALDSLLAQLGIAVPTDEEAPSDPDNALSHWMQKSQENPDDGQAALELGRLYVTSGDLDAARQQFERIAVSCLEYGAGQAALATMALAETVSKEGGEAAVRAQLAEQPQDPRLIYLVACADAAAGRYIEALEALVGLVGSAKEPTRGEAKSAAATIFEAAGRTDDRVEALRRKLARLLF